MHECNITRQAKSLDDAYLNKIKEFHKNKAKTYFTKQIEKQKENKSYLYEEIKFIFIVFPVPNKKDITEAMTREIKHYQDK